MLVRRRAIEAELRALVRHVVPTARVYFPRRPSRRTISCSWNGKHLRPTGLTLESQIHEVSHLLLSKPSRRHLPEFGLGPDPYRRSFVPRMTTQHEADAEELAVCSMQLLLVHLFGLDSAAVMLEVHVAPITRSVVRSLRRRYPYALPDAWWRRAAALARSLEADQGVPRSH